MASGGARAWRRTPENVKAFALNALRNFCAKSGLILQHSFAKPGDCYGVVLLQAMQFCFGHIILAMGVSRVGPGLIPAGQAGRITQVPRKNTA